MRRNTTKPLRAYQEVIRRFPSSPVAQKVPELIDNLREVVAYLRYAEVEAVFAQALAEQDPAQFRRGGSRLCGSRAHLSRHRKRDRSTEQYGGSATSHWGSGRTRCRFTTKSSIA